MAPAALIYLDTHVVAWLYAGMTERLSDTAARAIESEADLRISPMVRLELQYLHEIGRSTAPASQVVDDLAGRLGLVQCQAAFPAVVLAGENLSWTRDPFDRLIVAQASLQGAPLVTRDRLIHEHYEHACWSTPITR